MSSTVVDTKRESQTVEENGISIGASERQPAPRLHDGMSDHPLWQPFLDEIAANRQADIAEMNRLTDLELEKEKQMTLDLL